MRELEAIINLMVSSFFPHLSELKISDIIGEYKGKSSESRLFLKRFLPGCLGRIWDSMRNCLTPS